jgi:hypothetical protein
MHPDRYHQQSGNVHREWLAAIPIRFHVEGGPELRAAVAAAAEQLTAALGAAPDNQRSPRI